MTKISLSKREEAQLRAHIAQYRIARAAQLIGLAGGAIGAMLHGPAFLIVGVGFAVLFGLAKPGPNERFDNWTGRGR